VLPLASAILDLRPTLVKESENPLSYPIRTESAKESLTCVFFPYS
jgi:hypothetical protein